MGCKEGKCTESQIGIDVYGKERYDLKPTQEKLLKPSVNSLANKELTVFDTTPSGQRVRSERDDEPGDERPKPGDGVPGEATDGRRSPKIRILGGDTEGDWSWKPGRDAFLGDYMKTFSGVEKGMPEQLGRAREAAGEPGAVRYDT